MRWHDLTKIDIDNDIKKTPSKSKLGDLRPLKHWTRVMRRYDLTNKKTMTKTMTMTMTMTNTFNEYPQRATQETCDL